MIDTAHAAMGAALEIEDVFCRSFSNRHVRLAAIHEVVLKAITACQFIPPSDSATLPSAAPAGPAAVEGSPAVPPEDMPTPQPAPRPPVQDEAAVNQGKDQRAQKEETVAAVALAGAAQAGHLNADPRNSSRPAGEGPVLIPAGRTKPSVASKPYDPRPGRLTGVTITAPGTVVAVDTVNFIVACPGGDWQTTRPVVLVMERMRNGDMFGHKVLADLGGMGIDALALSIPRWTAELAQRGVTFIQVKGVGCRIEIAEASA